MMGVSRPSGTEVWRGAAPPSPRRALEQAILLALRRPPCVVDFSGGRDSSLVLAIATLVARREGLPLPVPHTQRFPADAASDEVEWQEMVIRHLDLVEWDVVRLTDEMDVIGKRARDFVSTYGVLFPATLFVLAESLELARGGSRLTGEGGDEVLGVRRVIHLRLALESPSRLARPGHLKKTVEAVAPRAVRFGLMRSRYSRSLPCARWLRPRALRRVAVQMARDDASEPLDWAASLRWHLRRRVIAALSSNATTIAADHDVLHLDPLLEERFVASFARAGSHLGFRNRTEAMRYIAEDLLPPAILERRTKSRFNAAYFTEAAREFVEHWDGTGVDDDLVDAERLREAWLSELPPAPSFPLLQQARRAQSSRTG